MAPTDHGWWQFLRARPEIDEVNFWRPGGRGFAALTPGEPFLFKLKAPHNAIGGFGFYARSDRLPAWRAWDVFGQANGVADEWSLLQSVGGYVSGRMERNRVIGCIAVTATTFFAPDDWIPQPADWPSQAVGGKTIDLATGEGARVWNACVERAVTPAGSFAEELMVSERDGRPRLITPRLGQASFRLAVLSAYGDACAVTREHSLPVIDAAHIKPWAAGGTHEVRNGLPLRRDLHRLFDLGFLSVRPTGALLVSRRLKDDYANGRVYYELEGQQIATPGRDDQRPDRELLDWHNDAVYLG